MSRLLACDLESRARSVVRTELESQMEAQSTTYLTARGSRVLYFRVLFLILYSPVRTPRPRAAAHRTCADPPSAPEPSRGMCYPTRLPVPLQAPHHRIEVRIRAPSESHLPAARAWRLWQGLRAEQREVRGCRRPERDGPRFSPGRCAFRLVAHARASTSNRWTCRPPAQRRPGVRFDVADCGHHMRDCCVQHGRFALVVR